MAEPSSLWPPQRSRVGTIHVPSPQSPSDAVRRLEVLPPLAGEHVRLSRRFPEEFGREKSLEQDVAHMRIEPPQTLDLRLRELQARHFQVLRPNKAKPIADGPRLSSHELSVGSRRFGIVRQLGTALPQQSPDRVEFATCF